MTDMFFSELPVVASVTRLPQPLSEAPGAPWLERLPYLMQVLETLGATWGRSRLMRLSGQSEVVGHVDINYYWRDHVRVHVPIVTTPSVRFQCGGHEVNMAAGECWIFDTWRHHRVLNQGNETRIHLVADTVGFVGFWNLLEQGRTPERREPGWAPRRIDPAAAHRARPAKASADA